MLTIWGRPSGRTCEGHTRRDFLRVGTLGTAALSLPALLRGRAMAAAQGQPSKDTSVIWLWLGGGPTHIETFDPKMDAPAGISQHRRRRRDKRARHQIRRRLCRAWRSAPSNMAIVRSFAHRNSGHGGGTHWVMTGYDHPAGRQTARRRSARSIGAIPARQRGPNHATERRADLRAHERNIYGDGPSWLGSAYGPFDAGGKARSNMDLAVRLDGWTNAVRCSSLDTDRSQHRPLRPDNGLDNSKARHSA